MGITLSAAPDWNEGNLLSVNIVKRNDKAITAHLADWRGETGCLVKDTNQYQAQIEKDYKMGNFESDYKCCCSNSFKISHPDLMEYSIKSECGTFNNDIVCFWFGPPFLHLYDVCY